MPMVCLFSDPPPPQGCRGTSANVAIPLQRVRQPCLAEQGLCGGVKQLADIMCSSVPSHFPPLKQRKGKKKQKKNPNHTLK